MKRLSLLLALVTLLGLLGVTPAAADTPQAEKIDFAPYQLELVDYTLPNGLRVILGEDHSAPVVAVSIWYHVGGADDPPGRSGFAHLFEHMMFEGSANIGNNEYFSLVQGVGGNANAFTTADQTAYWQVVPAHQLPRALWMESDRMASLAVTQEAFDTQREVVIQEFNQRVANQPYGVSNRHLFTQLFQGYPPYERSVIGSISDLRAATLDEVRAFFATYYVPNNATLTIIGDIDTAQTQALVQAYFADIPAGQQPLSNTARYPLPNRFPVTRTDPVSGRNIGYEEVLIDPLAELPRFAATVVGPKRGTPDYYALDLLVDILSSGRSSRLQQNIVQPGKAASAFIGLQPQLAASILYTIGTPNQGDDAETVGKLILDELDRVIADGVSEAELARVKTRVRINTITNYRKSALDTAETIQDAVLTFGDPNALADELAWYDAVTLADIQRVAKEYLLARPLNVLITLPKGEEVLAKPVEPLVEPEPVLPDNTPASPVLALEPTAELLASLPEGVVSRSEPPAALPVTESHFPPFETFRLENGLEVIFVAQHETPQLQLQLFVGGANTAVPADKQGVADLVADLLTKGTPVRSAAQIAEQIEGVGGSVNARAGLESISLSINAPTTERQLAFNMLAHLARFANFPRAEFEVAKAQTLTFLKQSEVDPDTLANRQFGRIAFGDHPYGYATTSETVTNLTRSDLVDFHRTYFKPNNALLVVVGDIEAAEARQQAEGAFGAWPAGPVPDYLDYPPAKSGDSSLIYLVDRPGSEQATIHLGNLAINARNPDRYALQVANTILGGGASSRLFLNLREDKGYTYGVSSRFARPNDVGSFRVISAVNPENVGDAIREIKSELERIRSEPVSAQELQDAKNRISGNFALAIEDPGDFANQLASRYLTGIPLDELNDYLPRIAKVSAEDVQNAAAQYIEAAAPIIVVVGDAETIAPQLQDLGKVKVVDGH